MFKSAGFRGECCSNDMGSSSKISKTQTNPLLVCLHNQNKSGFFGGPAFFQPIRHFESFSNYSDWLDKSRPSKKIHFYFDHVNRLYMCSVLSHFKRCFVNCLGAAVAAEKNFQIFCLKNQTLPLYSLLRRSV